MTLRLLAVHAHPDDESSKGAASYAYYASRGVQVMVVSATGGERGDVLNDSLVDRVAADRDMAGFRRDEMAAAQKIMGIEHRWLGFADSGLPAEGEALPFGCFALIPLEHSVAPLVKVIRQFRPQVIITYDENGGYPHPDHIRTHEVSVEACAAAADDSRYPDAGPGWQVSKLYYERIFNSRRIEAMHHELVTREPESPLIAQIEEMRGWMGDRPYLGTTRVPCGDYFELRDRALRAHASQVSPGSSFFFWPNELQRAAWPFEDYQLVTSLVTSPLPESDLFAGISDEQEVES